MALLISTNCFAQNDSTYYQHWVGKWYKAEGNSLAESPGFVVKRGLYSSSFEEYWMGAGGDFSMAWRAWDSMSKKWHFSWMSTDGLFQLWEGKKVDDTWYMYKTFNINGREILSRQAFIPRGTHELIRTSEHSEDDGKTWRLRFREVYRKKD